MFEDIHNTDPCLLYFFGCQTELFKSQAGMRQKRICIKSFMLAWYRMFAVGLFAGYIQQVIQAWAA